MSEELVQAIQASVQGAIESGEAFARRMAATAVSHASAAASDALAPAAERGAALASTAAAHLAASRASVVARADHAVALAAEHPAPAAAAAAATAALLFGPTRRALLRQTLGRLRSEGAVLASAQARAAALAARLDAQAKEAAKLAERVALAESEVVRGRAKLVAAAAQLRSLGRMAKANQAGAASLLDGLRFLRIKPGGAGGAAVTAEALRRDAAAAADAALHQRRGLERTLRRVEGCVYR